MDTTKEFRCIPKGGGGTFTAIEGVARIGTLSCEKSLGVCFMIDSERSFCAHMCVSDPSVALSVVQGAKLGEEVCKKLKSIARSEQWAVEHEDFSKDMILLCQHPTTERQGEISKEAAWYMVQGVRDFMQQCETELRFMVKARPPPPFKALRLQRPLKPPEISVFDETTARMCRQATFMGLMVHHTNAYEGGRGFVVYLASLEDVMIIEREDGYALGLGTGKLDKSVYVPKHMDFEEGAWCFSLERTD